MPKKSKQVQAVTIRLTADQVATMERLAAALAEQRPDLVALAGGELSTYAMLRIAVGCGLKQLEQEVTP
jgi:hypothetical protein